MIDLIPAHLRTTEVCAIVQGMLSPVHPETGERMPSDYSSWPLLRDALVDAGAADADLAPVWKLAILLEPGEDGHRLEWARCVGGERGEFVEIQCEVSSQEYGITCRGCNQAIIVDDRVCDGCVCNSPRGVNHGLVPENVCTCELCDRKQTGAVRLSPLRKREMRLWPSSPVKFKEWFGSWFPGMSPRRGFISRIACSWSDFLRHGAALTWWPGATDACLNCLTTPSVGKPGGYVCRPCGSTRRIPRPLRESHQPVERVRLSVVPPALADINERHYSPVVEVDSIGSEGRMKWSRVKCPVCEAGGIASRDCPKCFGIPLNEWRCDNWPQIVFEMPE